MQVLRGIILQMGAFEATCQPESLCGASASNPQPLSRLQLRMLEPSLLNTVLRSSVWRRLLRHRVMLNSRLLAQLLNMLLIGSCLLLHRSGV